MKVQLSRIRKYRVKDKSQFSISVIEKCKILKHEKLTSLIQRACVTTVLSVRNIPVRVSCR